MKKPVRVLVHGWYGAGNAGDEMLLELFARWCAEKEASVTALSVDPEHTRATHRIEAVDARDLKAVARAMEAADLFALGGGGLFHSHYAFTIPALYDYEGGDIASYARPVMMARQMQVPVLLWAQGVGPLDRGGAADVVKDVFSNADYVSVRDEGSHALLADIGVDRDMLVAPDPVWARPGHPGRHDERESSGRLGLVVRPWEFAPGWEEDLIGALRSSVDPEAQALVWIPFQGNEVSDLSASDISFIRGLMERAGSEYTQELCRASDLDQIQATIESCDRNLCMRLHAQILSLKTGKPTLCVEYDQKMSMASAMAGVPDALRLAPGAGSDRWQHALEGWLSRKDAGVSQARIRQLGKDALAHKSLLHRTIEEVAGRRSAAGWSSGQFDWLEAWYASASGRAISGRDAQINELNRRLASSQEALSTAETDLIRTNGDLRERDVALASVQAELMQHVALIDEQRTMLAQQKGMIEEQLAALSSRDTELASSREKLREVDREIQRLRTSIESGWRDTTSLQRELAAERDEKARTEVSLQLSNAAAAELAAQLQTITSSRSWRLTRPLRFARALVFLPNTGRKELLHGALRRGYWRLPGGLRHRLDGLRHRMAAWFSTPPPTSMVKQRFDWVGIANEARRLAIVPCAFEFDELVNQRPINLSKYLAAKGYTVIYVAWQWSRTETLARSGSEVHPGVWQIDLYGFVGEVHALHPRQDADSIYFITLPAPLLVDVHREVRARNFTICYDILDEWQAFSEAGQAPWFSAGTEHEAVLLADVVSAVSPPLAAKFATFRDDIQVIGNGYSAATLGEDQRLCASRKSDGPRQRRCGYFGHLTDAWFDWDLVLAAAQLTPEISWELIGYGEPEWVHKAIQRMPNIRLLGKVPPGELWRYACEWSAAIAPFRPGPLGDSIDPIKAYEYLYFGLPIVSSGIPHIASFPCTRVVDDASAFADACMAAVTETPDYDRMQSFLEAATWEARFDAMMSAVPLRGLRSLYAP